MKPTLPLLLSFIFLSLSPNLMLKAAAEPVFDTDGNELQPGVQYYIIGVLGGGLRLQSAAYDQSCPLTVVQSPLDLGDRWTFEPINSGAGPIQVDVPVNIRSQFSEICSEETYWIVPRDPDQDTGLLLINVGNSTESSFQIRTIGLLGYQLVYVGPNSTPAVGVYLDNGLGRLVVGDNSFVLLVFFRRADRVSKANLQKM